MHNINEHHLLDCQKLSMVLTSLCNLNCRMCPVIKQEKQTLSEEEAFEIAEFGINNCFKEIELGGGEPFLIPYIYDLLVFCCNSNSQIKIVTNATLLNDETMKKISNLSNLTVQVSLDGTEISHDSIRRVKGSFIKTKDNIRKMIDSGIKVSINTVIQRLNVNYLIDLYNIFENSHILFHAFSLYEEQDYSNSEDIIINEADEIENLIHILTVLLEKSINNNNNVILTEGLIYNYLKRLTYQPYIIHPGYKCTVPYRSVIVNQKGHVFPCFHTNWKKRSIKLNK